MPITNKENHEKRKIFISGGSSGIGKSLVKICAGQGWEVATADQQQFNFEEEVHFIQADLTQKASATHIREKLDALDFQPDVLVFNAGRGIHQALAEGDPDQWEYIIQLNLMSVLRLLRAFLPGMLRQGGGDVVFVTSVSARTTYPYGGIYAATKAALEMIAETLRLEQQPHIRVTRVLPGVVNTSFFDHMIDGGQTPESIGWGALQPDDVAQTIFHAITQARDVALNEIVIRPRAQPM